jgi:hypothetical protein
VGAQTDDREEGIQHLYLNPEGWTTAWLEPTAGTHAGSNLPSGHPIELRHVGSQSMMRCDGECGPQRHRAMHKPSTVRWWNRKSDHITGSDVMDCWSPGSGRSCTSGCFHIVTAACQSDPVDPTDLHNAVDQHWPCCVGNHSRPRPRLRGERHGRGKQLS